MCRCGQSGVRNVLRQNSSSVRPRVYRQTIVPAQPSPQVQTSTAHQESSAHLDYHRRRIEQLRRLAISRSVGN